MIDHSDIKGFEKKELLATLPLHGGDIQTASKQYDITIDQWIDLSTVMNPKPYPVPAIPSDAFINLPYWKEDFLLSASEYYQQTSFLAVAGTQSAIQILPSILNQKIMFDVLVPSVGYKEHSTQWKAQGNNLNSYRTDCIEHMCNDINESVSNNSKQHIVIIRPNNPTALMIETSQILQWSEQLDEQAYLIVDEAFIDTNSKKSLLVLDDIPDNIVVLRSFGKFFGLGGIRLGFVFANTEFLETLSERIGIWQVNGPAQYIAAQALSDKDWQEKALENIQENIFKTKCLFQPLVENFGLEAPLMCDLFLSYSMKLKYSILLHNYFARHGVLTRVIIIENELALFRIGSIDHSKNEQVNKIKNIIEDICKIDLI